MCGRFTLRTPLPVLAKQFQFDLDQALDSHGPRYNIAPSQAVFAVRKQQPSGKRELTRLFWGLVPSWSKDNKSSYACINARADTVATKPSFRSAFRKRRCLVLADGYYEWLTEGKNKQPFLFEVDGGKPFAFAGIWESWRDAATPEGPALESCSLITTEPNDVGREVHDRMPVIMAPENYDRWLDPGNEDVEGLQKLLATFPGERMTARPVNRYVSNARNEGEACIAPPA